MKVQVEVGAGLRLLPALGLVLFVAACGGAAPLQDFRDSNAALYGFLTGTAGPPPNPSPASGAGEEVLICPQIEVRQDTAYYDLYVPKEPPDANKLRYQAVINKVARQCDFQPDYIAIKLGFAGRVLVGPAGGPGEVALPVRAELAGKGDKVVWSKTYKVPVSVAEGAGSQFFVHVADDLVYQLRYGEKLDDFRVYIGFDKEDGATKPLAGTR